jgi:parallel beta-helix repeat protein
MRQAIARPHTCRIKALPILVIILAVLAACSIEPDHQEIVTQGDAYHEEQGGTYEEEQDEAYEEEQSRTYYVSNTGSDLNDGQTPATAWKTISKVNSTSFEPGNSINFKRGDTWREQLTIPSSGTADSPITFGAYGQGPQPRIAGTVNIAPQRNAIRNAGFEDFIGLLNDGITDDFLHFYTSGGRVEAVSDTPVGGDDIAAKLVADGSKANLYHYVYLPADTTVTISWKAKSIKNDGTVAIRHQMCCADKYYLQTDLQTWSTIENWNLYPIAGSVNGRWQARTMTFRTDNIAGKYQLYFRSGNSISGGDITFLDELALSVGWETYRHNTYRLGTGYEPRRVLLGGTTEWKPALNASNFYRDKDSLDDHEWVYDAGSGDIYFRDDTGNPATSGIRLEVSVPEAGREGECGIYIDQSYVTLNDLAVMGWPDDTPAFKYVSGIVVTDTADHIAVNGCLIAHNYRVGLFARSNDSRYSSNTFAYNGGNGFSLNGAGRGNTISYNEAKYNGFWGVISDDGEGIALGRGTSENLVEGNDIHHNNRHPQSWKPGGLVIFNSSHNVIRYNRVHDNYKAGVVIDGAGNQFYYNLVYNNGIGLAETFAEEGYNLKVRNHTGSGNGGNWIVNNIFYGGTTSADWSANLFINRNCTDTEIRNNVIWGFENVGHSDNVQIRIDSGINLTGSILSNNVIGPEGPGFIHYAGKEYLNLIIYQQGSGQGSGSISEQPQFVDPSGGDFHLRQLSPLIDSGLYMGLSQDYAGNPIEGIPDIGVLEYQN